MSSPARVRVLDEGVELEVPNTRPLGALVLESDVRTQMLRLRLDGETLAWARLIGGGLGFVWARMPRRAPLAIVPPIRAREARDAEGDAWPRFFAHALAGSPRALPGPGRWRLAPMRPPTMAECRARFVSPGDAVGDQPPWEPGRLHVPVARALALALDAPTAFVEPWARNGSGRVLPLRDASAPDGARVKSWRKHARERALPPILLAWVSALDAYVVLDGHDRLLAAQLERVAPSAVALLAVRDDTALLTPTEASGARADAEARYALAFAHEPRLSAQSRRALNQRLVAAYDDYRWPRVSSIARHRSRLDALAYHELASHPLPEDVRAVLLRGPLTPASPASPAGSAFRVPS